MKRLIVLMIIWMAGGLYAQQYPTTQQLEDVVYKKNGEILRGTILEEIPEKYVKIQTKAGNIFVIEYKDISKITKEPVVSTQTYPQYSTTLPKFYIPHPIHKKNVTIAWLFSFFLNWGAGHYYLGETTTGIIFTITTLTCYILTFGGADTNNEALTITGFSLLIGNWLADWITAIISAKRFNKKIEEVLYYKIPSE